MIPPLLRRLVIGAIVMAVVMVVGIAGFWILGEDRDLLDATYMLVITLSTVGFGEKSGLKDPEKIWTIIVIVVGISVAAYILGGFLQKMTEGEIQRALGLQRTTKEIARLHGHTIVCGFGRMGRMVCDELSSHREQFVVIESNTDRYTEAKSLGYLCCHGDATEEEILEGVNVAKAKNLVSALSSDADNVYIALTARNLNDKLKIIARGEFPTAAKKLIQAGADRVVLPASIGAKRIAAMIARPFTAEMLETVIGDRNVGIEIDEFTIPPGNSLAGKTVQQAEIRSRYNLLVVAVRHKDGDMRVNPNENTSLGEGDTIILLGEKDEVDRFRVENPVD